jgi:hypothetical protein
LYQEKSGNPAGHMALVKSAAFYASLISVL